MIRAVIGHEEPLNPFATERLRKAIKARMRAEREEKEARDAFGMPPGNCSETHPERYRVVRELIAEALNDVYPEEAPHVL